MQTNQKFSKALTVTILAFSFVSIANVAWASGGRTDSNGCHNSKKEGYHCHNSGSGSGSGSGSNSGSGSGSGSAPTGTDGSGSICLTFADCMTRGRAQTSVNAAQALNYFQQALLLKPNDTEAFTNISILEPYVMEILGSCTDYKNCMNLGYAAVKQKNYQTALVNFKRALAFERGNKYAVEAIRNVCQSIQASRN